MSGTYIIGVPGAADVSGHVTNTVSLARRPSRKPRCSPASSPTAMRSLLPQLLAVPRHCRCCHRCSPTWTHSMRRASLQRYQGTARSTCGRVRSAIRMSSSGCGRAGSEAEHGEAGGTAWLWACPEFNEAVDVLFVDEAAQMCLAAADAHRVQCLLGYNGMNPSRLGMRTFGSVSAFIASFSPMILLSAST